MVAQPWALAGEDGRRGPFPQYRSKEESMGFSGKWDMGLNAREKSWMSQVWGLIAGKMDLPTIEMGKAARGKGSGIMSRVLF